MSKEVMQQALEALEHCQDVIIERGLGGNVEFAEMWGLQLPLDRAGHAIDALRAAIEEKPPTIKAEDVIVETYTVTRGGFAVHPQSGVRLTHKPTGTVVQCDAERSLHRNRETAWKDLEKILSETTPVPEPASVTYKEVAEVMNSLWAGTTRDVQIAQVLATKKLYIDPPAQPAPVPEGWKLVPTKLTEAMEDAAMAYVYINGFTRGAGPQSVYRAMLATAPTPPTQRQWVGLTDEEYIHITDTVFHQGHGLVAYYLAIEAALRKKNS